MSREEQLATERMNYLLKQQESLEKVVTGLQRVLYEVILINLEQISKDPTVIDVLFRKFTRDHHLKVINQFANDIMQVGKKNDVYFRSLLESDIPKNYADLKKEADTLLLQRFGLTEKGELVEEGFLDSFVKDPTIKRELKAYAYKSQVSGVGLEKFKQGFKDLISPTEGQGSLQKFYGTFATDTYNQADAMIQEHFAVKLDLQAALYLGGTIEGTRDFCRIRNGRVFTRKEIKLFGTSKDTYGGYTNKSEGKFNGKPKGGYDPLIDRGGANCRHAINWLTNKQAMRRRDDLELNDKGELLVKG